MFGCTRRVLPAIGAALAAGLVATGSMALADGRPGSGDHPGGHHHGGHHHHKRCCDQGRYSAWDEQWLMMSIEGDLFEIQGGKMAQEMGTTQGVRELGAVLVRDHSKSLQDAKELAAEYGIDVPDSPSPSQQWELRAVREFQGREFDRWYADLEVQDHVQDIQEATDERDDGCNREIREDAAQEIPTLQQHLKLAQAALAAVGGPKQ